MEIFSKDLVAINHPQLIKDRYDEEVENTKNKVVTMENLNLSEYSTTKQALQFYSRGAILVVIGVLTSAITYPLSIRIVKRLFGVRDFLNVHMVHMAQTKAALPIILNANAFVLGISQGFINHSYLAFRYPQEKLIESIV